MPAFVLDAHAVLALVQNEAGAAAVQRLLERAEAGQHAVCISVVNLGEVLYTIEDRLGTHAAQEALAALTKAPIAIVDVDQPLALRAARLKVATRMGYLDCFAAALADQLDAKIVTGDPDFKRIEHAVGVEWLPAR